jgi:hypothetical protein
MEVELRLPFRFRLDLGSRTIALELEPLPETVTCAPASSVIVGTQGRLEQEGYRTLDVPLDGKTQPGRITMTADGLITRIEVPGLLDALLDGLGPKTAAKPPGKPEKGKG